MPLSLNRINRLRQLSFRKGIGGTNPLALILKAGGVEAIIEHLGGVFGSDHIRDAIFDLVPGLSQTRSQSLYWTVRNALSTLRSLNQRGMDDPITWSELPITPGVVPDYASPARFRIKVPVEVRDARTGRTKSYDVVFYEAAELSLADIYAMAEQQALQIAAYDRRTNARRGQTDFPGSEHDDFEINIDFPVMVERDF